MLRKGQIDKQQPPTPKQEPTLEADTDEVGVIGISLALTALAGGIIFGDKTSFPIQIICLIIYILGGLATSFLYFTFLVNKLPQTMNKWRRKGGMNFRGILWIFKHYILLFGRQMFSTKGNTLTLIRELGYLTVLAILFLLWLSFGFTIAKIIF